MGVSEISGAAGRRAEPHDDQRRRLRLYAYLSAPERRTYLEIMRLFTDTLLADLGAGEVAAALAEAERAGRIDEGESQIDTVLDRLRRLAEWGNLVPGRREPAATIADFMRSRVRYQVTKLALRVQRDVEGVIDVAEGAREVSRELLPAISTGLREVVGHLSAAAAAEETRGPESAAARRAREHLAREVTTVFLQHAEFASAVRDFYAYLGGVIARYDLGPAEMTGFKDMLLEYVDLIASDVLRYSSPVAASLTRLTEHREELLRRIGPAALPGDQRWVERAPGRSAADWQGLADWFIGRPGRPSEVAALREATSRAISALLANVKRATSAGTVDPGRRRDLLRLAGAFAAADLVTAHALYAATFGLHSSRHLGLAPDDDRTTAATPWHAGARVEVPVNVRSRANRAPRGKPARVLDDPLGEQALLAEAAERERRRASAVSELAGAAPDLATARLSGQAMELLCELLTLAGDARDTPQGTGTAADPVCGLAVTVAHSPGSTARIGAVFGELVLHDSEVTLEVT
ncbi:MAG: DUF2397 family protein [Streptosporangiales bacterium]|nr:DUF2397 family protein [Streptosporangiales bacterium]